MMEFDAIALAMTIREEERSAIRQLERQHPGLSTKPDQGSFNEGELPDPALLHAARILSLRAT